jgi:D-alanine-D-alanine ligase
VLSGGPSLEARASRISAGGVYAALKESAYDVVWLDLAQAGEWRRCPVAGLPPGERLPSAAGGDGSWMENLASLLQSAGVEMVFPAIHGSPGEDGQIQALCRSLSIPWVGCDAAASIACYDKLLFKRIARSAGLPVVRFVVVDGEGCAKDPGSVAAIVEREVGYPCIVKPSRSGSSLGLSRVTGRRGLAAAISKALGFDKTVLVEELFRGTDVEIGVLENGSALVGSPVELEYEGVLYDFEAKYVKGDRRYLPARCSAGLIARLKCAARTAFRATGCSGMARVDLLVDSAAERFVVNEINTIPYMPESSTFAGSIGHATGQTYAELVTTLAQSAWAPGGRHRNGIAIGA